MKNLVIAAWLVVVLCFSASTARAADWSNGTFSCDLTVVEAGLWWVPWQWGVWQKVDVKFYQNVKPDISVVYNCSLVGGNSLFLCTTQNYNPNLSFPGWGNVVAFGPTLNPGISKSQACGATFDKAFFKR